jgi:hypothetical protein
MKWRRSASSCARGNSDRVRCTCATTSVAVFDFDGRNASVKMPLNQGWAPTTMPARSKSLIASAVPLPRSNGEHVPQRLRLVAAVDVVGREAHAPVEIADHRFRERDARGIGRRARLPTSPNDSIAISLFPSSRFIASSSSSSSSALRTRAGLPAST